MRVLGLIPIELRRFAVVGAVGFAVDAGFLLLFTGGFGWSPAASRIASFAAALLATWTVNRLWTFQAERPASLRHITTEFARYLAVQMTGAVLNFLIFTGVADRLGHAPAWLLVALACGSSVGLAVNYAGARTFVFRESRAG